MPSDHTTPTLAYYAQHATDFAASTVNVDFRATQDRFASLLASGATILDFGCGSGRDTKHFLNEGFSVVATDGSPELCAIAQEFTGIPVRNEQFGLLEDIAMYDGVWACSSILHVPKKDLTDVFERMARALKPHGIVYTSFKHGTFEGMRNGRYFTDFTEATFRHFLSHIPSFTIVDAWVSGDVRAGREDEQWLNLILRKA